MLKSFRLVEPCPCHPLSLRVGSCSICPQSILYMMYMLCDSQRKKEIIALKVYCGIFINPLMTLNDTSGRSVDRLSLGGHIGASYMGVSTLNHSAL